MPSGNLEIDKNSDIFVHSPQVNMYSPSILISADGKTIVFRVYFVDGRDLLIYDKVSIFYGYTLLKGPMKTEDYISQLRWHNLFSVTVSEISFKFIYDHDLFESSSIKSDSRYYSYAQSMSGTTLNVLEFNRTNVTAGNSFIASFNATNLKYSSCAFEQQSSYTFFYSIIVPLMIAFVLILFLALLVILIQRCCRKRSTVLDQDTAHYINNRSNISRYSTNTSVLVTPFKEQENKTQQAGLYFVTNTFNNLENNDGFTGVVVSHLNQQSSTFPTGPASVEDIVQYTPTLNAEHNTDNDSTDKV